MVDPAQFHFLRPLWLLTLIPAGVLVWFAARRHNAARRWQGVVEPLLLSYLLVAGRETRRVQPWHLLAVLWLIAIVALAGPTWQREPSPFAEDTAALVIAVKVTPTMQGTDIQPSRLERATQKIHDLLALRAGAKAALVAYAGSAHVVVPLTKDADIINTFAAALAPDMMPKEGEDLVAAIRLADEQLRAAKLPGSILLIADLVLPEQVEKLKRERNAGSPAVQILAMASVAGSGDPPAPALNRSALEAAAHGLGGSLVVVMPDATDVRAIARRAQTSLQSAQAVGTGERWQDAGYWLLPVVVLLGLFWFRRGWVVQDL